MKITIKSCLISIVLLLFLWGNAETSEDLPGQEVTGNAVTSIRDKVISFFHPVVGEIKKLEDGTIKVITGGGEELEEGARLSVFRKGDPFYHPTTKALIGRAEDFAGVVEIKSGDKNDGVFISTVVKGDVKSGDIARLTSSKVKLAFFQDRTSDWSLSDTFFNSLKDSGRFTILEKYSPVIERDELIRLSKELGAEVMLFFSTPVVNDKKLLRAELFWVEDSKLFANISSEVSSEYINELTRYEDFIAQSLTDKEPWSTQELERGELFAIGDVIGDGKNEIIVSDGTNIRIFNMQKDMQEIWYIKGNPRERHLSVDLLDLNANGRDEIFVTSLINEESTKTLIRDDGPSPSTDRGRLSSYVIEYMPSEGYRRISEHLPFFMRVASGKLLMQRFSGNRIFSTSVYTGKWEDGRYLTDRQLDLPEGVNIYGFVYVHWKGNDDLHIVSLDDYGFLNMYKSNELIWRSSETYGRPTLSFKKESSSMIKDDNEWYVRGRLLAINTDKGQKVIAVKRNEIHSKVPRLGSLSAEVYTLWWDGRGMDEALMLQEVSGSVTDYWIEGKSLYLMARSGLFSFMRNAAKGALSRPSILYYYNFGDR